MSTRTIDDGGFGVSIEEMSTEDCDAVFALLQATPGIRLGSADCPEAMDRYLLRNPGMSFVARSGNRLVGCVMSGHDGRRGYLYHLAVVPDFRRRGIASRLVTASLAKLGRNGINKTHIQVVVENAAAHEYWVNRGWQRRTDITTYTFATDSDPNGY